MKVVSKDISVLLKKVGFDDQCRFYYNSYSLKEVSKYIEGRINTQKEYRISGRRNSSMKQGYDEKFSAPFVEDCLRFLRVERGLHVTVHPTCELLWYFKVYDLKSEDPEESIIKNGFRAFETHNEAMEEGIKYALKYHLNKR